MTAGKLDSFPKGDTEEEGLQMTRSSQSGGHPGPALGGKRGSIARAEASPPHRRRGESGLFHKLWGWGRGNQDWDMKGSRGEVDLGLT